MAINLFFLDELSSLEREQLLLREESDLSRYIQAVTPIIEAVRANGDEALARYARELDHAPPLSPGQLKVTDAEFDAACELVDADTRAAIEYGISNIQAFHLAQKPEHFWLKEIRPGAPLGNQELVS